MLRADRINRIKAERGKLVRGTLAINVVCLIRGEEDRLPALAQQQRHLGIAWVWASCSIHNQDDEIGVRYCHPRLILYRNVNHVALRRLHPTSVDEAEAEAVPVGDRDQSIACCPRAILHHGAALANESIEERTLPNVRPTDQRDER
jgi:hypothetical protein